MPSNVQPKGKKEELDGIVGDVVSKIMEEEEKAEKLKKLDSINKWYYRDPQGIVQGDYRSYCSILHQQLICSPDNLNSRKEACKHIISRA